MTEPRTNQSAESEARTVPPLGAGASAAAPATQAQPAQSDKASTTSTTGKSEAEGAPEAGAGRTRRGRFAFMRSLQFRLMVIFVVVGMILAAIMSVLSYNRMVRSAQQFVDEELSQISSVAINYNMIIPRRWEAPRRNHERVLRLRQRNGSIVLEYSTVPTPEGRPGMGPGRGMGRGHQAQESLTPSIVDLYKFKYDIIIAPLYGRPGDALYIPPGVPDGFYTVMVADERVRAFVATNTLGQRFVVARPLESIEGITHQALLSSIWQFLGVNLIIIPILILSVRLMFVTLNRIAKSLYKRRDDDLSPVISDEHMGFVPSELDSFILALNRLFVKIDEGIQSKRRFIADAAHEMRTPLTALSLQAESLAREDLPESARIKVEKLHRAISRERDLMTALLTLAREQNKVEMTLETIDIFDLFIKLIEDQGLLADEKDIDLGVEGKANYQIVTDRMRLMRVMSNLVSNAIKYTPRGGRINLMAEPLSDGRLRLTVQDDGPGIPEEQIGHILEPFYRVHGDRSEIQGTGLGLAIVKASCDSIKADLKFANVAPHGLSVTVDLPNLDPKTKDVAAQTAGTKAAGLKGTGAKVTVEPKGAAQSTKA